MKELMMGTKDGITEDQVVLINNAINNTPKYHTYEQHNFYASRKMLCLYCSLGSKPVHKHMLKGLIE